MRNMKYTMEAPVPEDGVRPSENAVGDRRGQRAVEHKRRTHPEEAAFDVVGEAVALRVERHYIETDRTDTEGCQKVWPVKKCTILVMTLRDIEGHSERRRGTLLCERVL